MTNNHTLLTERDISLFKYLLIVKTANSRQINHDVFKGISIKNVQRRLKKLQNTGYIKKISFVTTGTIYIAYSLTDKSYKAFFHDEKRKLKEFKSKSKAHDLTLVDIRSILMQKNSVLNYLTENALRYSKKEWEEKGLKEFIEMNCDAVLKVAFQNGQFNIALEYEASMKFIDRYKTLLKRYYQRKSIGAVFYICKNKEVLEKVKSIDRTLTSKYEPKFYFALLEDVLSNRNELHFTNVLNEQLKIK